MTECGVMDVSPSLRIEDGSFDVDNPKFLDLVDFASFTPGDFGSLEDLVEQRNNEVDLGVQTWNTFGVYTDNLPSLPQATTLPPIYRESETSDKMWGAGQTFTSIPDTKITSKDENGMFYNVFCKSESPDQSYKSEAIDTVTDGLTLFSALLNEKPVDLISSQSHRSPGSDCVSYVSASAFSDSGISTTLDENASPGDPIDVENMLHPHLDSMYTPVDDLAGVEPYQAYLGPVDGTSTILESVLRGTVRRGQNIHQLPSMSQKTLTVMTNMNPLPPINTAFKNGSLAAMPTQMDMINTSTILNPNNSFITNHISSNNHIINTTNNYYEYLQQPTQSEDDYVTVKIAPVATSTTSYHPDEPKPKKRKYTKRGTAEETTSKGRLLHFCSTCNKGFKDKYSVNVHLRTHTGEKPFLCNQCGKAFRQKAHLAKHVQIHLTGQKTPNKR